MFARVGSLLRGRFRRSGREGPIDEEFENHSVHQSQDHDRVSPSVVLDTTEQWAPGWLIPEIPHKWVFWNIENIVFSRLVPPDRAESLRKCQKWIPREILDVVFSEISKMHLCGISGLNNPGAHCSSVVEHTYVRISPQIIFALEKTIGEKFSRLRREFALVTAENQDPKYCM